MQSVDQSPPTVQQTRRYDLDWLRSAAFGLLILSHVGMYYNAGWWFVKSPAATPAIEPFMSLALSWRLMLLFVISGAATAFLLTRSHRGFLWDRSRRLLVPVVFAVVFIIPPQMYYAAVEQAGYTGGYLEFWGDYLRVARGLCTPVDCFDAPTWSHLWFVAYLWFYTILIWAAATWRPERVDWARRMLVRGMRGAGVLLWPILLLVVLRLLLRDRYPPNMSFIGDWYRHAIFLSACAFGFLVARERVVWQDLQETRWLALAFWIPTGLLLAWQAMPNLAAPLASGALRPIYHVTYAINQWSGVAALLGFASLADWGDSRARRYITEAIFPFYIVHQTAIVVLSQKLKPWALPTGLEALVLIIGTLATCVVCFELVRRVAWLRPMFGLRRLGAARP